MTMESTDPTLIAALGTPGIVALIVDGIALGRRRVLLHRLALPLRSGTAELTSPLLAGADLPADSRGAVGRWVGDDTVAYWSGRVRFAIRGARALPPGLPLGVMIAGTAVLSEDRRRVRWTERLRVGPLLLVVAVASLCFVAFPGAPWFFPVLVAPLFFVFYGIFVAAGLGLTSSARREVLGTVVE